jgi:putative transposase
MAQSDEIIEKILNEVDFKHVSPEEITGKNGLLKQLTKRMLEKAMNAELDEHLGYEKHERTENGTNSRNGKSKKTVSTEVGSISLDIPRDRKSDFSPKIIPKHPKRFKGFDEKIISMYSLV